jgi:DNA invertase Pin-like site-specific DNA recombinase
MSKWVAIYLRVSTQDQSTELQRHEITAFVESRGWQIFKVYEDKETGTTSRRAALSEMLAAVRERKVDIVITWKLDRLFRSLKDLITVLHEFHELGVAFVALKDQIDKTTAAGRLMTHLLGAFAEFEASLIRERVRSGLANARRKGVTLGRPKTIDVERVLELRKQGHSLSEIATQLGITKSGVSKTLSKLALQMPEIIDLPRSKK